MSLFIHQGGQLLRPYSKKPLFLKGLLLLFVLLIILFLSVILFKKPILDNLFASSVDPEKGIITLSGINQKVLIRRDKLGIPVVDASSLNDAAFGVGYVMASDRLEQMISLSLLAQGRLAEMAGQSVLDMDIYIRTLGLQQQAKAQYDTLGPQMKTRLKYFSKGVNAYLKTHKNRLPMGFVLSGYQPKPWRPIDSVYVFSALNLGLSLNLQEELDFLNVARKVGLDKAAWLFPVYPDEPLPFKEAAKLKGVDLAKLQKGLFRYQKVAKQLGRQIFPMGMAASNNWVLAPSKTKGGASILANDTHLLLSHPSLWMLLQIRTPNYHAGGIAIAGIPGIVAGSNGKIAWGMTMVMADTQDLFVEKLRQNHGQIEYLYKSKWYPVQTRTEIFKVNHGKSVTRQILSTRHGPLINDAIRHPPKNPLQPQPLNLPASIPYGLAVSQVRTNKDDSMQAMFDLGAARTVQEALPLIKKIRFIALNMVVADKSHIAWQVTGTYPKRKQGTGQLPSPGWTGTYDWDGTVDVSQYPSIQDPASHFIATANQRTVKNPGFILTRSWYYPERFERIKQVLENSHNETTASTARLQFDQKNVLIGKVQKMLLAPSMAREIAKKIATLPKKSRQKAQQLLSCILNFDGVLKPASYHATCYEIFESQMAKLTFMDELGGPDGIAWKALVSASSLTYSAQQDHLLGRQDSPFWDNVNTPQKEDKADIIVAALLGSYNEGERYFDTRLDQWQWGKIHTYRWQTAATHMLPFLELPQQIVVELLSGYLDRGPYPAGGDKNTINAAGHTTGLNYDVWDIPEMRLIVDFSQKEPLQIINSDGQSGNPVSPHYADGIKVWLKEGNRQMSLLQKDVVAQYTHVLELKPATQAQLAQK